MTKSEYIKRIFAMLPVVADRGWHETADTDGMWIRDRDNRCPLCSLANQKDPSFASKISAYWAVIKLFGETESAKPPLQGAMEAIAHAADNPSSPLRARLKRVFGMAP
ncbi:MAG: hypothetical protein ACRD3M_18735 [Thermoanaerobaculia bacterium]